MDTEKKLLKRRAGGVTKLEELDTEEKKRTLRRQNRAVADLAQLDKLDTEEEKRTLRRQNRAITDLAQLDELDTEEEKRTLRRQNRAVADLAQLDNGNCKSIDFTSKMLRRQTKGMSNLLHDIDNKKGSPFSCPYHTKSAILTSTDVL